MKLKIFKAVLLLLVLGLVLAQIFSPADINGPFNEQLDISADPEVPQLVSAALKKSCYDCHSNEPRYPAYSKIGAVKYYLNNHVKEGSKHLNFSEWNNYSPKDKDHHKEEICEEIEEGNMPLWNYKLLHQDVSLNEEQILLICEWAKKSTTSSE